MSKLSIIIPCYNNEANIPITKAELQTNEKFFDPDIELEIILVNDGSKDNTLDQLLIWRDQEPLKIKVVNLSGNFGSLNAILAGLHYATGNCLAVLAADLQDPPELLPEMVNYWKKGVKLVLANRVDRDDSLGQILFSKIYHYCIKKFALKNVPQGGFNLVLFDKQLKDEILKMNEKNTNIFYLLTWMRFPYISIPYTRKKREIGKSQWTLNKKIKLFVDSFVAFSFFPIRLISIAGIILGIVSLVYAIFIIFAKLFGIINIQGWSTLMVVVLFVSSFQMIALGILGEYIWRNLDETRKRPNFIVDKVFQ